MPLPVLEHQSIVPCLSRAFIAVVEDIELGRVFAGVNVADQAIDWTRNDRCPGLAVYQNGNPAEVRQTRWLGGPDFAVEVVTPGDRGREKPGFYGKIGTRELLFIERPPWSLELSRLGPVGLESAGRSTEDGPALLLSDIVPLTFALVSDCERLRVSLMHRDGVSSWRISVLTL